MVSTRVLFVNHTSAVSGAEQVLLNVASAWPDASVFLFEEGPLTESMAQRGVNVIQSKFGGGLSRLKRDAALWNAVPLGGKLSALAVELSLAARRHSVIYANSQKAFVMGAFAAAIARRPLIWHLHDIISAAHFGAGQRRVQIALANRFARAVIGPSQAVTSAFVAAGGRPELARVVNNGFDISPVTIPGEELRRSLGLPSGPLIGVFSRLAPWKGQHVVLRALCELPGVQCLIAGDALFGEDAYAESLRTLAKNLGIADRVHFLGQRSDVPQLMRAVDIVVHPSVLPEPFGTTLLEAMMTGAPIIATDTGGSAEVLADGEAGTLVPPGESAALAAAVKAIFAKPEEFEARVQRAGVRVRQNFTPEKMKGAIAEVIQTVAASGEL